MYISPDLLELNPFVGMAHLDFNLMPIDRHSFVMALWRDTLSAFDLLILNTFELDETIAKFAAIEMPTLLVVHNGRILSESESYRAYVRPIHREILVLSPQVAAFLKANNMDSTWLFPGLSVASGDGATEGNSVPRTFCVQGKTKTRFKRRNYESIVSAARKLKKNGFRNFSVRILDKSNSVEGYRLRWSVFLRGLRRYFSFSQSIVGYEEFFEGYERLRFCVPS